MALSRSDVVDAAGPALAQFEDLIRSLSDEEWQTPTRCEGWNVSDVVAHVTGNFTLIATGRLSEFNDPGHVDREVAARKGRSRDELADEFRDSTKLSQDILATIDDAAWCGPPLVEAGGSTLGEGVEAIFYDVYVHAQDINEAIGRQPDRTNDAGLRVSVSHLCDLLAAQGYRPTTVALDGLPEFTINGGGNRITGDPYDFILVGTGRKDAASMGLDETINVYRPQ